LQSDYHPAKFADAEIPFFFVLSSKHVSSILAVLAAFIIGDGERARMVLHAMAAQRISHAVTADDF